ncbi:MAG: ATP-binding protein [Candidatus Asgardarchaeia archaeon]
MNESDFIVGRVKEDYTDKRSVYPFAAIVNQELLKTALMLIAINPKIGGLLIYGEKGSGKSMAVRALADVLPEIKVVKGCPFNCDPDDPEHLCAICYERYQKEGELPFEYKKMKVVTLPLGASEDMVTGTLDIEKVLNEGLKALQPGILARANRNILYIDEINLLPDHITDDILDAAASGWNVIEREGISLSHPAQFILIGTMNPEEGSLRPQILDRLSLSVTLVGIEDEIERVEVIKRNLEFIKDPQAFKERFKEKQEEIRNRIKRAKEILEKVEMSDYQYYIIAKLCKLLGVDGHRPDIVIALTAQTLAALNERTEVLTEDIELASYLALSHRTRNSGFDPPATINEIKDALAKAVKEAKTFFRDHKK